MESRAESARRLDAADPLAPFRDRFVFEDDLIYLDGNSLGRLPLATSRRMRETIEEEWAGELVLGWSHWLSAGTRVGDRLAPLIGARSGEVAVCDQTSINLFKLASAGLVASGRKNIVTDLGNFPSDRYVLGAVAAAAGGRLISAPEDPSMDDLAEVIDNTVGLVSLSHVAYRSGTMADGAAVTGLAHERGALMLWDLAHSAGAVPVDLDGWSADLAVGCTYKYLNAGPGAPGFLYVRSGLQDTLEQPILGWFGHRDQFGFAQEWEPANDLRRFLVGTPPIISLVGVEVGVALTVEAGVASIRAKSVALTAMFIEAIAPLSDLGIEIVTPLDPAHRGSHITVAHTNGFQIASALRAQGVIPDFRAPNLVRFGFTPLYTTFVETARAAQVLTDIVVGGEYESFPSTRTGVT